MVVKIFKNFICVLFFSLLFLESRRQTKYSSASLIFTANDFSQITGNAIIFLYRKTDLMSKASLKEGICNIVSWKAEIQFKNIPLGNYAAILVLDENSNGKIDRSLGILNEPLRYTNNWELSLLSGLPTFEKIKFSFRKELSHQCISNSYNK